MTVKRRSWHSLYEPKNGRPVKILIWSNGDFETPGQELTLHPKNLKSWNSLLGYLTVLLQPRFGAIRKLYHLETRKQVFCPQDIKPNEKYVAVGAEKVKFRKNRYLSLEEKMALRTTNTSPIPIVDNSFMMAYTKKKKRTVVYFMVSGRTCHAPLKVVFIETDFLDYGMILEYLGHRLDIGEGIRYLCNVNGKPIENLSQLKHGELYVAVPFGGKFVKLDYRKLFSELLPIKTTKARRVKRGSTEKAKSGKNKSSACIGEDLLVKTQCREADCQPCMTDECLSTCASLLQTDTEAIDERILTEHQSLVNGFGTTTVALKRKAEVEECMCMIRDILNRLLDDVVAEIENRDDLLAATSEKVEIEQHVPSSYKLRGDLLYDVDTKASKTIDEVRRELQAGNLITFADLARNKLQKSDPSSASGTLEANLNREDSLNGNSKKSVSFLKTVTPEIIFETEEAKHDHIASDTSFETSLRKLQEVSILKTKDDSNRVKDFVPQSFNYPPKTSFEHVRDSIQQLDNRNLSKQLLETFLAEGRDSLDSIGEQIVMKEADVIEENSGISRGVQKGNYLIDRGVQVASDLCYNPTSPSNELYSHSPYKNLYDSCQNFEVDGVSATFSTDLDGIAFDTNLAPVRCRREDCVTFACSEICFKKCPKEKFCYS